MATLVTWSDRMRARVRARQSGQDDQQGVVPSPGQSRRGRVGGAGAPGASDSSAPPTAAAAHALGLPPALVMTTGWAICVLVIAFLLGQILDLLSFFSEVTVPLAISLLTTALAAPVVDRLQGFGLPRRLAAVIVVVAGLAVFGGILTVVGSQVAGQFDQLRDDVSEGLRQVQMWLRTGPLGLSDEQLNDLIDRGRESLQGADTEVVSQAAAVGTTLGHFLAGLFIVLFATFFFCAEGSRMWRWVVSLLPAAARPELNASGQVAWVSLTAFVRATVLVALADAIGVAAGAVLLGVPLALALGLLVFVGAFVPIIGAAISGSVAVLVALVAQGPVVALLMLGAVVLVQQLESHVLQPFLMGRFVAVHPLGIILAIAAGLVAGGVVGALIAVPLVACANAVGKHLAGRDTDDDPHPETAGELTTDTAHDPTHPGNVSTSAGDDPIDPSETAGPTTQPRSAH
ncbi:MAG: AI-2E family transporter [Nocardioidaceae bacterium]|nr:AI-2E family transporter [Nocardioidaceae bacterium]